MAYAVIRNYCLFSTRNKAFRDKRVSEQQACYTCLSCLKIFLSPKGTEKQTSHLYKLTPYTANTPHRSQSSKRACTLSHILRLSPLAFKAKHFSLQVYWW